MSNHLKRFSATIFQKGRFILCLIAAPIILLLPGINKFPFPPSSTQYSDFAISHFPNASYLAESLSRWKTIPLWSPTILGGYPFIANPLSGIWYLPNWLVVILPIPIAINLLIVLHLIWGGAGVYRLLKGEGLTQIAALFGGLGFELMPKLFAHYGAGHVSLIMAVCWTPWLIVCAQKFWDIETDSSGMRKIFIWRFVFPALALNSIILADIRWVGFAALFWISYFVLRTDIQRLKAEFSQNIPAEARTQGIKTLFSGIVTPIIVAIGLTAPFLLPFLEYVQHSTRSQLTPADNLVFSLPFAKLLGLIFPAFGDYFEWIVYPGVFVILLAGLCWAISHCPKYRIYWTVVFISTLIFALGSYLPGSYWMANLPGISLMRVPSRIVFISGMALICLAARGLDGILKGIQEKESKIIKLILVALAGFLLLLNIGAAWISGQFIKNLVWSLIFGITSVVIIWNLVNGNRQKIWILLLMGICIVDWMVVDVTLFSARSSHDVLEEANAIVHYLKQDKGIYRVYSPSYSLPQQVAAINHLELADGIDPLQLTDYVNFMEEASGVNESRYSVTLPPFNNGDPASDNQGAKPNPVLLGLLNVKYVIADFDIQVDGLKYLEGFDQSRIYLNQSWLPRAWLQPPDSPVGKNISPLADISWSPNRIRILVGKMDNPQRLILSEVSYPGWRVTVDGKERPIETAQGILRSVKVLPGDSAVEFRFQPMSLTLGALIYLLTIFIIAGNLIFYGSRKQQ